LLFFLTFEGGRGHDFVFTFSFKNNLEGGGGMTFFFPSLSFTLLLFEFFIFYFVYS
jgi:hypothetical protein